MHALCDGNISACYVRCMRPEKDQLVKYFVAITKNDTMMNNWLSRARYQPQSSQLLFEWLLHACVRLRCFKPPLTDEEKAERRAAAKKRKNKKKVKSEEGSLSDDSQPKNLGYLTIFMHDSGTPASMHDFLHFLYNHACQPTHACQRKKANKEK